jgi:hypothetical protein
MLKASKRIESFVFKNYVVCGENPNDAEVNFAKLAKNISLSTYSVNDIIKSIDDNIVSDTQFKLSFSELSFSDTEVDKEKIRYFFRKVHKHLDKNNEINLNNSEVHIEHIMPQNIGQWPNIDEKTHSEHLWKLGNLCLLSGPLNIEISNKPFIYKIEKAYKKSSIKPNDEIAKYDVWNVDNIKDRQEKLYNYAIKIW